MKPCYNPASHVQLSIVVSLNSHHDSGTQQVQEVHLCTWCCTCGASVSLFSAQQFSIASRPGIIFELVPLAERAFGCETSWDEMILSHFYPVASYFYEIDLQVDSPSASHCHDKHSTTLSPRSGNHVLAIFILYYRVFSFFLM